jgi:hypothetical protein
VKSNSTITKLHYATVYNQFCTQDVKALRMRPQLASDQECKTKKATGLSFKKDKEEQEKGI